MNNHDLATEIAHHLFTDGNGQRAHRLVLWMAGKDSGDGWAEEPMRDHIERILDEHQPDKAGEGKTNG